ncbi:hypothetical protein EV663_105113 [Rhodovulum bhavnagarense]|uniref:PDZ domain-containing protein n=1 Tax=Rhodovulum bhavnagarense TaxID=992286 RepID=A0A4R2RQD1_9RHOB|nr:hypothetical protein [Rhodovulum bhavnagarense]TCP61395.1 hypothetical protein EV663_105113 [Rhodovulum bhavnagarense]
MTSAIDPTAPGAPPTCLVLNSVGPAGRALGLRPGDRLIALNGLPLTGTARDLDARLGPDRPAQLLVFRRDEITLPVLSDTARLGRWDEIMPPDPAPEARHIPPETMRNWELFRDGGTRYDLQPLDRPILALVATPLWLAHHRLWQPLAAHVAASACALPGGAWLSILVYLLGAVYVWRAARTLFRVNRMARGFVPFAVVAAPDGPGAQTLCDVLAPGCRHAYAAPPKAQSASVLPLTELAG